MRGSKGEDKLKKIRRELSENITDEELQETEDEYRL